MKSAELDGISGYEHTRSHLHLSELLCKMHILGSEMVVCLQEWSLNIHPGGGGIDLGGELSWGGIEQGGIVQRANNLGGELSWGELVGGNCPGGIVPGGN